MNTRLSERVDSISGSMTLKMSERASALMKSGKKIYNLTAGELPFRPPEKFIQYINKELDSLKSYHYSPVAGISDLRDKIINFHQETRKINFANLPEKMNCLISHGGKHALANFFAALLNPGDEVILISPCWTSYPEQIKVYGGKVVMVATSQRNLFSPDWKDIKNAINSKTKAIVINSPHNPTGIDYSKDWMEQFAHLMEDYPEIMIVSDEIYYLLNYRGAKSTYYYQINPQLLRQTIIIDGISKFFASTGLRMGWAIAPEPLIKGMSRFQAQTTSGANSLIQRGLLNVELPLIENYLDPIKKHLNANADTLRNVYSSHGLEDFWYQPTSAFYYLVNFSHTRYAKGVDDCSIKICEELLDKYGIATAPGSAFGMPHSIRINLGIEEKPFGEAAEKIVQFIKG